MEGDRLQNPEDVVRLELETASARDVKIFPALVGGAQMRLADSIPPSSRPLVRRHAIEIRESGFKESIERLIQKIGPQ